MNYMTLDSLLGIVLSKIFLGLLNYLYHYLISSSSSEGLSNMLDPGYICFSPSHFWITD